MTRHRSVASAIYRTAATTLDREADAMLLTYRQLMGLIDDLVVETTAVNERMRALKTSAVKMRELAEAEEDAVEARFWYGEDVVVRIEEETA